MHVPPGRLVIAIMVILCEVAACGGNSQPPPPSCPNDVPSSCPSDAPTFAQALPIFQTRCGACHAPMGMEAVRPFQTYDQIQPQVIDILFVLSQCLMPPVGQPQPTASDRHVILGWIECGALNN